MGPELIKRCIYSSVFLGVTTLTGIVNLVYDSKILCPYWCDLDIWTTGKGVFEKIFCPVFKCLISVLIPINFSW